jgi:hypothetical protein
VEDKTLPAPRREASWNLLGSFQDLPGTFLEPSLSVCVYSKSTRALTYQNFCQVTVKTLPEPRHWDGQRTVRNAVQLVSAAPALVVGMHVRTTSNIPYLHFDLPAALQRRVVSRAHTRGADEVGEEGQGLRAEVLEGTHCPGDAAGRCVQTVHGCGQDSTTLKSMARCLEGRISEKISV